MEWNISGKTVVITGANQGIGKETARTLGRLGAKIVMVCRSRPKAEAARDELLAENPALGVDLHFADLAVMEDVRRVARELSESHERIDVLINNAGIYLADRTVTGEGMETVFAVNHLAPFLLTRLLWKKLQASAPARVVNVTSEAHRIGRIDFADLHSETRYRAARAYADAKLANILFTAELARRAGDTPVTVNALHPGAVYTNFAQDNGGWLKRLIAVGQPFLLTPARGAINSVHLAKSPDVAGITGRYFRARKPVNPIRSARDPELAARLWNVSSDLVELPRELGAESLKA